MRIWRQIEEVGSAHAMMMLAMMVRILPHPVLVLIAFPVSFFYYMFSRNARVVMKDYCRRISPIVGYRVGVWRIFLSFSITLIEKCESWIGKIDCRRLKTVGDIDLMNSYLKKGQGVLLIVSHIGSSEELRALSDQLNREYLGSQVPVLSLVDFSITDRFNHMLKKLNADSMMDILSIRDISVDSIERIQGVLDRGGIVVIAGDRSSDRNVVVDFLGAPACFPFGAFYLPLLLGVPSFFATCVRTKDIEFTKRYTVHIRTNMLDYEGIGRSQREAVVRSSCQRYVEFIESILKKNPCQWFNFYDFWAVAR